VGTDDTNTAAWLGAAIPHILQQFHAPHPACSETTRIDGGVVGIGSAFLAQVFETRQEYRSPRMEMGSSLRTTRNDSVAPVSDRFSQIAHSE
jgi:hypothetical protein